ncbi:MAG: AAC(3) family N-acetyltransferase [Bacillota bacterium]|nr:AAC(3) family N-acetyltransferase [Bacillota bacterium]HHU61893.1 AAC(3) family N-acetyltransferase [Natronincola sp.]
MHTKEKLYAQIERFNIKPQDTLLIHSSMKAVGEVEGGADTILDIFIELLKDGLFILPTHTWDRINSNNRVFDVVNTSSCVGILTELFRKRPGVVRSWHPTHSVAALGKDALEYIQGEEQIDTPCRRDGCWGKLYDRDAKILFLGALTTRNTIIHGAEEWANIPDRLTEKPEDLQIRTPDGKIIDRTMYRHASPAGDISQNYGILEVPLEKRGILTRGKIGSATSVLVEVRPMIDFTIELLKRDPDIFLTNDPIPSSWY